MTRRLIGKLGTCVGVLHVAAGLQDGWNAPTSPIAVLDVVAGLGLGLIILANSVWNLRGIA